MAVVNNVEDDETTAMSDHKSKLKENRSAFQIGVESSDIKGTSSIFDNSEKRQQSENIDEPESEEMFETFSIKEQIKSENLDEVLKHFCLFQ